ncbi:HAD family hydrolase [Candidatus Woesearchaeota archaeon]|nr:MAG: HAD family hydrolase [Candidatus Woesearchaeota archaeon]
MKYKVISFDLDGTLVKEDFDNLVWNEEIPKLYAEKYSLPVAKAKEEVFAEYEKLRGRTNRWTDIGFWFNRFNLDNYKRLLDDMKYHICLFEDTLPVIKELNKDFRLIIISNAERKFLDIKIKAEGLNNYFQHVFSAPSDFHTLTKGHNVFIKVCDTLKIRTSQIVHVGNDLITDYEVPARAGIRSFLLDRSGKTRGSHVVHNLYEFKNKVLKLQTQS